MQYRTFERIGKPLSLLGLGTLHLPCLEDETIDQQAVNSLVRAAADAGINYLDLGYFYCKGQAEKAIGQALQGGLREKFFLVDKMPMVFIKGEEEVEPLFSEQLERTQVDYFDGYLVHGVDRETWKKTLDFNVLPFIEEMRNRGKIKHIGFSFHDNLEFFKEVIDFYPWDFCLIQLNYADANFQAGVEGMRYAGERGIPVVVMEPLKGGMLVNDIPASIADLLNNAEVKRSAVEWALRWVADFPEVMTVLSGSTTKEQLTENMLALDGMEAGGLTDAERNTLARSGEIFNELVEYSCTGCRYCLPCPQGLDIPGIMARYRQWCLFENSAIRRQHNYFSYRTGKASSCISCKACERKCPQGLPIAEAMGKIAATLETA